MILAFLSPVTRENIRDQIEKLRKKFLDMKTTTIETPENPGNGVHNFSDYNYVQNLVVFNIGPLI